MLPVYVCACQDGGGGVAMNMRPSFPSHLSGVQYVQVWAAVLPTLSYRRRRRRQRMPWQRRCTWPTTNHFSRRPRVFPFVVGRLRLFFGVRWWAFYSGRLRASQGVLAQNHRCSLLVAPAVAASVAPAPAATVVRHFSNKFPFVDEFANIYNPNF